MIQQTEGNVRFERSESPRFEETAALGEAIWTTGDPFKKELRELLIELLSVVTWEEALARAVGEILDGHWSRPFVEPSQLSEGPELWPAQRQGISQAMWASSMAKICAFETALRICVSRLDLLSRPCE